MMHLRLHATVLQTHLAATPTRDVHEVESAVDVLQLPFAQPLLILWPLILRAQKHAQLGLIAGLPCMALLTTPVAACMGELKHNTFFSPSYTMPEKPRISRFLVVSCRTARETVSR